MTDYYSEDKLKTLIKKAHSPVKASSHFKEQLCYRILDAATLEATVPSRFFGLTPTVWVSIGAVIALGLIIYGVRAVPQPNVVINTLPIPPQSSLPDSLASIVSFLLS
jgi:hypothetical protein